LIKPRVSQLIELLKAKTNAKIAQHCCGIIRPYIEDMIEIGIEVINPVQVSAKGMDTEKLKRDYGDRISFWGAIDTQRILTYGSRKEVRQEVRKRIDHLAPGGGYLLAAVHNIQPDVPPENVIAIFEAAIRYGKYR